MTLTNAGPDTVEAFASYVVEQRGRALPPEVVTATTRSVVDTLACMAAGRRAPVVDGALEVASRWGGAETSTVCAERAKLPAYLATFVNASMVHQHDFDDTHDRAVCHPTSASLPAALAVAEERGGVAGGDLVTAVAVGNDIACRLAAAITGSLWDYPWIRAPFVGIFGAVAAAGYVGGLTAAEMRHAFGLALPQVASTLESVVGPDSDVRSIRDGLIYKDAVLAVELAAAGVRGDARVFDGPYGFYEAYHRGEYDPVVLVDGLGETFRGTEVSLKPWPSCRHTHATLTALLDALAAGDSDPVQVEVRHGTGNQRLIDKPWPQSRIDALCHLPYVVATALVHGSVPLSAFEGEALDDPRLREELRRVSWVPTKEHDRHGAIEPGHVVIRFADGQVVERAVDIALGHPSNPMPRERFQAKITDCLQYAGYREVTERADTLMGLVDELPNVTALPLVWAGLAPG